MRAVLFGLLAFGFSATAAQLNLQSGDLVTIQPNVSTTVTCEDNGNGGTSCNDAIGGLNKIMKACQTSSATSYCMDKYWPDFKAKNYNCAMSHVEICLDACQTSNSGSYCADKCSK